MKLLRIIYKTKTLSEYGLFLTVALLVLLILGNIFIPQYKVQGVDTQLLRIKGKHFKFDDAPHVSEFILSVKSNDGYICMGTSESTPLRDGNYYEFLDQDTTYDKHFSILGGAGWTCGLHSAMLINHANEVDSLKLIYFINPVYWQSVLAGFKKSYWIRYLNYGTYKHTLKNMDGNDGFASISSGYKKELNPAERLLFQTENWLRTIRKPFFNDLRYWISPQKYLEDLEYFAEEKGNFDTFECFGTIDTSYLDTSWNVTHEFMGRTWLNPIAEDTYRDEELEVFINLCKNLGVETTFVLGPVNEIYIAKYHPPYLQGYLDVVARIRKILTEENADFIDASDIGNIPGSFIDNQHHSSYGAYLIYQKIKTHLHEKADL